MPDYKDTLRFLTSIPSIAGCEKYAAEKIREKFGDLFDEIYTDAARNIILVKKSKKNTEDKKRVMLDAHFDEIGMVVSGITDEGLLRVMPVGGVDRGLLPASEAWIYTGEKLENKLYGVFTAIPPHLPNSDKMPEWSDLLIDIGYPKAEAEKLVSIGDPVGYYYSGDELLNGRITGRGFDDKACAAGLICAAADTPADELAYDVYVTLTAGEEVGGGGAASAAWTIRPEFAIITDVNFALTPGVNGTEGGKLGGGPMISLSAVTDRKLTKKIREIAKAYDIPSTPVVEATSTGTNASSVVYVNEGIPAAVVSLPLAGMHSYNELLQLDDAESFKKLISEIIKGIDRPLPVKEENEEKEEKEENKEKNSAEQEDAE